MVGGVVVDWLEREWFKRNLRRWMVLYHTPIISYR